MSVSPDPMSADLAASPELVTSEGFNAQVTEHWTAIGLLAYRLVGSTAQDVVQDALADAWRKRSQYDPARGTPRTWLLTLVADRARKSRRRSARRREVFLLDDLHELPPSTLERDLDIDRAITRLSHRQRLAIGLYYYLGLPVAEVAAVMGCAEGTVKSTLVDARHALHRHLGEDFA